MNYKLLLPSYRTRQQYLHRYLQTLTGERPVPVALNVGSGEGELDAMVAAYVGHLDACDINADDVAHAAWLNRDVANLDYRVADATSPVYDADRFDLVLCLEVIEHVSDGSALLDQICRVLKPGGRAMLTAPNHDFPFTYDPLNALLRVFSRHAPVGAYAFGHARLCKADELAGAAERAGLRVAAIHRLSGYLVGACEAYVPGIVQRLLKSNHANAGTDASRQRRNRRGPGSATPRAACVTDALVALDRRVSGSSVRSIGLAMQLEKPRTQETGS